MNKFIALFTMLLRCKADQLMNKLSEYLNNKDPQGLLYHYTSHKGLEGILRTKKLYLTEHKYLNDPSEIQHGKKIILKCLQHRLRANPALFNFIGNLLNKGIDETYQAYITSFCCKGDFVWLGYTMKKKISGHLEDHQLKYTK